MTKFSGIGKFYQTKVEEFMVYDSAVGVNFFCMTPKSLPKIILKNDSFKSYKNKL